MGNTNASASLASMRDLDWWAAEAALCYWEAMIRVLVTGPMCRE